MARKLVVEIIGDASSLEKSYRRSAQATDKFGRNIEGAGRGAVAASLSFKGLGRSIGFASGAFLGGAGFIAGAKASVAAASSLNEQQSKTNAVFLQSAKSVTDWSKTTVNSMGLAQVEALQTASSFGALLAPIGIQGEVAAAQSEKLTQLGADLASFYDTDVQSALDAIRSGLVGESEPLRRYGVQLSEARVQAEAFAETGKTSAAELTNQDKVLARIAITFRDTAKAQGDFARTSGGFANQQRIFKANILELETAIGAKLLPKLTLLLQKINKIGDDPHKVSFMSDAVHGFGDSAKFALTPTILLGKATFEWGKQTTAQIGRMTALSVFFDASSKSADNFAKTIGTVTDELKKLSDAQQALLTTRAFDFSSAIKGVRSLVGQPLALTASQRQDLAFAQDPSSEARIREQRDKQQRRFEFAMRQVNAGNLRFFTLAKDAASQVASFNSQLASIQAARVADAKAKRDAARKKQEEETNATLDFFKAALGPETTPGEGLSLAQGRAKFRKDKRARDSKKRQAALFRGIGLTATGDERAPTRGNLLAQLRAAETAVEGTALDTKQLESKFAFLRRTLNTGFKGLTGDTKKRVAEWLDALAGKGAGGPATKTQAASLSKLVAGVGLGPAGLRQLEFNLAGAHLTTTPTGIRGGVTHVHTTVNLDGREVARNTTVHQQRDKRRRATQTRGRPLP